MIQIEKELQGGGIKKRCKRERTRVTCAWSLGVCVGSLLLPSAAT